MTNFLIGYFGFTTMLLIALLCVLLYVIAVAVYNKNKSLDRVSIESIPDLKRDALFVKAKIFGNKVTASPICIEDIIVYRYGDDDRGPYSHRVNVDGSLTVFVVSEYGDIPIDSYSAGSWLYVGSHFGAGSIEDEEKPPLLNA